MPPSQGSQGSQRIPTLRIITMHPEAGSSILKPFQAIGANPLSLECLEDYVKARPRLTEDLLVVDLTGLHRAPADRAIKRLVNAIDGRGILLVGLVRMESTGTITRNIRQRAFFCAGFWSATELWQLLKGLASNHPSSIEGLPTLSITASGRISISCGEKWSRTLPRPLIGA